MNRIPTWIAALLFMAVAATSVGCGSSDDAAEAKRGSQDPPAAEPTVHEALVSYEWYLNQEAAGLVRLAERLQDEIAAGRQFNATFRYATSRVFYGHVRPAAGLFPALNARINDLDFPRIERTLYKEQSAKGLDSAAAALVTDVRRLRREIAAIELYAFAPELAHTSEQLMREVSGRMFRGEEEPHAKIDMVDISASVEGAEAVLEALAPLLAKENPDLVRKAERIFRRAYLRIGEHGEPARNGGEEDGTSFIVYNYFTPYEKKLMWRPLNSLKQPFREATEQLRGS